MPAAGEGGIPHEGVGKAPPRSLQTLRIRLQGHCREEGDGCLQVGFLLMSLRDNSERTLIS